MDRLVLLVIALAAALLAVAPAVRAATSVELMEDTLALGHHELSPERSVAMEQFKALVNNGEADDSGCLTCVLLLTVVDLNIDDHAEQIEQLLEGLCTLIDNRTW